MRRKGYVSIYISSDKIQEEKPQMKLNDVLLPVIRRLYHGK